MNHCLLNCFAVLIPAPRWSLKCLYVHETQFSHINLRHYHPPRNNFCRLLKLVSLLPWTFYPESAQTMSKLVVNWGCSPTNGQFSHSMCISVVSKCSQTFRSAYTHWTTKAETNAHSSWWGKKEILLFLWHQQGPRCTHDRRQLHLHIVGTLKSHRTSGIYGSMVGLENWISP